MAHAAETVPAETEVAAASDRAHAQDDRNTSEQQAGAQRPQPAAGSATQDLAAPPAGTALARGTRAPAGTRIEIYLPDKRTPQPASYAFTVGESGNPLHPVRVEIVHDAGVFVNTGRLFFEGFDYLYDAAGGYVGYGWNGRLRGDNGAVTPGIAQ